MPTKIARSNAKKDRLSLVKAQEKLGIGDTCLSVQMFDGKPFLVDQNGKLVHNVTDVEVVSGDDRLTTITMTAFDIDRSNFKWKPKGPENVKIKDNFNALCQGFAISLVLVPLVICTAGVVFFALFYV